MTNLEALKSLLPGTSANDTQLSNALELKGIDPGATWIYSTTNPINCDFYSIVITQLQNDRNIGIKAESEGGYSKTYDVDGNAFNKMLENIAKDSGCQELIDRYSTKVKIVDRSNLW
ncbi:MAG: DUF6706 family protein [Parafilimonas sp.]